MISELIFNVGCLVVAFIVVIIIGLLMGDIYEDCYNRPCSLADFIFNKERKIEISEPEITDVLLYSLLKDYGKRKNMSFEDVLLQIESYYQFDQAGIFDGTFYKIDPDELDQTDSYKNRTDKRRKG